jgi:serine/threonine-protein kinase
MDLPARIGRYEVIRLLGQGGMGRVLLAKDSVLGRYVAVKLLRGDLGLPPESRQVLFARMRQEARAAAAVGHPHMVTLHDMGEEADVGLYLVFEYLAGPTLRDKLGEGPVDLVVVAAMARQLGDALTAAHEAGVIHRDVKPENIILSVFGPKLTDFGIARLPDSTLTAAGSVLGTPAYSAPEALSRGEFGPASDQFSLGATLFEAVCGKRAYPGEDTLTVAARIATEAPPPLPFVSGIDRAGSAGDSRLVSRLDAVLGRAMARDPAQRYPSCRALGEALASEIEARFFDAPRTSDPPPRSLVPRATRRVHNAIAAAAVLVIVGLVVYGKRTGDGISLRHVAEDFAAAATTPRTEPAKHKSKPPPAPASDRIRAFDAGSHETPGPADGDAGGERSRSPDVNAVNAVNAEDASRPL